MSATESTAGYRRAARINPALAPDRVSRLLLGKNKAVAAIDTFSNEELTAGPEALRATRSVTWIRESNSVPTLQPEEDPTGGILPELRVRQLLAATNLSRTWLADDLQLNCRVVLKELAPTLLPDAVARERFVQEAQIIAQLASPNIVPIRAAHLDEPPYFFTMPFIDGQHLGSRCSAHAWRQKLRMFIRVCKPVIYAHEHGVIHRDLKPPNILVDAHGEPQLLDFGLGTVIDENDALQSAGIAGTLGYMAPEQTQGDAGSTKTDVYALGCILYELLSGEVPIKPDTGTSSASNTDESNENRLQQTLQRIRHETPRSLGDVAGESSRELNAIVQKALRKSPDDRYASVAALAADVEAVLTHQPVAVLADNPGYIARKWLRRHRPLVASGAALLLIATTLIATSAASWQRSAIDRSRATASQQAHRITNGRLHTLEQNPVAAARDLLDARLAAENNPALDVVAPNYALLEHFRQYPCAWGVPADAGRRPTHVAWTADGTTIVTIENDGSVHAWDIETRDKQVVEGTFTSAHTLCTDPTDPSAVLVACEEGAVVQLVRDDVNHMLAKAVLTFAEPVQAVAASPRGDYLVVGLACGLQVLGRTNLGWQVLYRININYTSIGTIAFNCCSENLFVATLHAPHESPQRHAVAVYDCDTGITLAQRDLVEYGIPRGARFTSCGKYVLLGQAFLQSWDWQNNTLFETLPTEEDPTEWGVRGVALARRTNGDLLAVVGGHGLISLYDLERERFLYCNGFHACSAADVDLAFSPDGTRLASVGCDGLRVWRLPRGATLPKGPIAHLVNARISIAAGREPAWLATRSYIDQSGIAPLHHASLFSGAIGWPDELYRNDDTVLVPTESAGGWLSADGVWLAGILRNSSVTDGWVDLRLSRASSPLVPVTTLRLQNAWNATPQWATQRPDHLFVNTAYEKTKGQDPKAGYCVEVRYDPETNVLRSRVLHAFDSTCNATVLDSRQEWLATCSEGRGPAHDRRPARVALYRTIESDDPKWPLAYEFAREFECGSSAYRVEMLRDEGGELIITTAGARREVALWNERGEPIGSLNGHKDSLFDAQRLNDRLLVTTSRDHSVRIWDVWTQRELCAFRDFDVDGQPRIAVRDGRIAIIDNHNVEIIDTRDIEHYVETLTALRSR